MTHVDGMAFLVGTLAVWRISHLLAQEDGPFDVVFRLRRKVGQGFFGTLLDCFLCLSLWIALPFAFLSADTLIDRIVAWLALSGDGDSTLTVRGAVSGTAYRFMHPGVRLEVAADDVFAMMAEPDLRAETGS